jgi:hypothetical protein
MMVMMSVEQSVECFVRKTEVSEKTCPSAALSTTNPTLSDPVSNPGRRDGKTAATNHLSCGTASSIEKS